MGPQTGDPEAIYDWAMRRGADPAMAQFLFDYLTEAYRLGDVSGMNADVVVAQSHAETGGWNSAAWSHGNPAGLGVTRDAERGDYTIADGITAARTQMVHLGLYALGKTLPESLARFRALDFREDALAGKGWIGVAPTIAGLTNRWADDPNYGALIAERLNQMAQAGLIAGGPAEVSPIMAKPFILLAAGHNSENDGGDSVERGLTPKLAVAYRDIFQAAGYTVEWINPTSTKYKDLTALAAACGRALAARTEALSIMFDLHFNTRTSAVHAIAPHNRRTDGRGMLASAFVQGRVADDIAPNNGLDVKLAQAVAAAIAAIPGMTLRTNTSGYGAGIMLENETRVGAPPINSRLAMMGATAGSRLKAIRLTVEHGGTNDATKPDFYNNCARAALRAVEAALADRIGDVGGQPPAKPGEEPPTGDTGSPTFLAWAFGEADGASYDPTGPVSALWRTRGRETGNFPRLEDTETFGSTRAYLFADGSVALAEPGKPVRWMGSNDPLAN